MDAAVEWVADDGMADRAEMHADLVRPAGADGDAAECDAGKMLGPGHARHGSAGANGAAGRHLLAMDRVPAHRILDAMSRTQHAAAPGDVFLLDLPIVTLRGP